MFKYELAREVRGAVPLRSFPTPMLGKTTITEKLLLWGGPFRLLEWLKS